MICLHKGMTVVHTVSMSSMTTIKVERSTRDGLRALASERGVTMDAALKELREWESEAWS